MSKKITQNDIYEIIDKRFDFIESFIDKRFVIIDERFDKRLQMINKNILDSFLKLYEMNCEIFETVRNIKYDISKIAEEIDDLKMEIKFLNQEIEDLKKSE